MIDMHYYLVNKREICWVLKILRYNGYHIETDRKNGVEYLYIISTVSNEKHILEKLPTLSFGIYILYSYT